MKAYQLRIALKESRPLIWRRAIVPSGITFSQLSLLLNEIMGWDTSHLFAFGFKNPRVRITEIDGVFGSREGDIEASETYIDDYLDSTRQFEYTYDFGDWWEHLVTVEKKLADYPLNYPQVLNFVRACPFEDCGGIDSYEELLGTLAEDEWPKYDIDEVNEYLRDAFYFIVGQGDERQQLEIMEDLCDGKGGLYIAKDIRNRESSICSQITESETYWDDLEYFEDEEAVLQQMIDKYDYLKNLRQHKQKLPDGDLLADYLMTYTKPDLQSIGHLNGLKALTKYNKGDLVGLIAQHMLQPETMTRNFSYLRGWEIDALNDALEYPDCMEEDTPLDLEYLEDLGYILVIDDEEVLIPEDVAAMWKKINKPAFKKLQKQRAHLLECLEFMINFYGSAPVSTMLELYNKTAREEGTISELTQNDFLLEYDNLPMYFDAYYLEGNRLTHRILIEQKIEADILSVQGDLPYYLPTYDELHMFAGEHIATDENCLNAIGQFLIDQMDLDMEAAFFVTENIQICYRMGMETAELIKDLDKTGLTVTNQKQRTQLYKLLENIRHNTRTLMLRGWKPIEITQKQSSSNIINLTQRRSNKTYANASCPCGSGKKYKHCCGKK